MKGRWLTVAMVLPAMLAVACTGGGTNAEHASRQLSSHQILTFPITSDVKSLDPALVQSANDITFVQNLYGGLYRFNDKLVEVPYAATSLPTISSNGLTYTFHLRHNVTFSNGDPVTAADVIYSWSRAARLNGSYGYVFRPVVGYSAVTPTSGQPTATTLSGLSAPDPYTVVATLTAPASYWLTELALWTADIVDPAVIPNDTNTTWWTTPSTAIGTGPFRLTSYVPKDYLTFAPVQNWWGGSTGSLTQVKATVLPDQSSQVTEYLNGGFDELGPGANYPPLSAVEKFLATKSLKSQYVNVPGGSSTWVGFNFTTGPFAPNPRSNVGDRVAKAGRLAFSLSINRTELVNVTCGHGGITCKPATGGVIAKGLVGYLGDGNDPTAKFNPAQARKDLKIWDPKGTKRKGLTYWTYASSATESEAQNLQAQWQQNLGVHVNIQATDFPTFLTDLQDKSKYMLFLDAWGADYDNPQDWFDNNFICSQAAVGLGNDDGICDPRIDAAVKKAESSTGAKSVAQFKKASRYLIDDVAMANIEYGANQYFIKPYVKDGGGNALYDNSWTQISILKH
ncbi:MAG: peptide ABC transporter substrate-binding protein [Candidatus Dormiibacterota bacterium]